MEFSTCGRPRPPTGGAPGTHEEFAPSLLASLGTELWRRYNDEIVQGFLARHLAHRPNGTFLKTDLFEEALGNGWFWQNLPAALVGMDLSHNVIDAVRGSPVRGPVVRADVRHLPFADASLAGVISTSTLDHFRDPSDLQRALHEIARVLRPGGMLIMTLDNPLNPVLAFRNVIPHRWRRLMRMTPYEVGYTCGPDRLRRCLMDAGLHVRESTAILHFPRAMAALVGQALRRLGLPHRQGDVVSGLIHAERLGRWPSRWLTAHYIAVYAIKP